MPLLEYVPGEGSLLRHTSITSCVARDTHNESQMNETQQMILRKIRRYFRQLQVPKDSGQVFPGAVDGASRALASWARSSTVTTGTDRLRSRRNRIRTVGLPAEFWRRLLFAVVDVGSLIVVGAVVASLCETGYATVGFGELLGQGGSGHARPVGPC
jgi:hypothetical protein